MITYYPLFCLLILQGGDCVQFLIKGSDGVICIIDFMNEILNGNRTEITDKNCITISTGNIWPIDYYFSERNIYYVNNEKYPIKLFRSPFSINLDKTSSIIVNETTKILKKLVVDWIHDTFYVISGNLTLGNALQSENGIILQNVFTQQDLIALCNQSTMHIMDVNVDPYTKSLFVLASPGYLYDADYPEIIYIISSDLKGNKAKIIIERSYIIENVHFTVDVSEKKLYLTNNHRLYKFNYNGRAEKLFVLPYTTTEFSVLGKHLYMYHYPRIILYEVLLNHSKLNLYVHKIYNPQLEIDELSFKVLDIHKQRRKRCGKFICDRNDCPYLCEVRPSGDTCVCRESDAKDRDGVTCYRCGRSNLTSSLTQPTIVNGEISYPSNFPWHAVLYSTIDWNSFCGGSLITSNVVLTAAHCVTSPCETCRPPSVSIRDLMVALGKTYQSLKHNETATVKANVTKIMVHEDYMGPSLNYNHDIALLYLDVKVKPNNYIMPACLDYNLNQLPTQTNFTGYMAGFGYTEECGSTCSSQSDRLLYTTAVVMSFSDCYKASNKLHSSTFHKLTSDKICIGNGSVSAVQKGDSGGGLTLAYRGLHYVVGVVSHKLLKSKGFSLEYSFGAFTNVNKYMNWIKQNIPEGA